MSFSTACLAEVTLRSDEGGYPVVYYIHGKANSTCLVALREYDELVMVGCKDEERRAPA